MEISIRQKRFSLSDRYTIKIDGEKQYKARRGFFSLKIKLADERGQLRATIKKSLVRFGKGRYSLSFPENERYRFNRLSSKKGVWELENGESTYTLYGHEGYAYSLFQGEQQIAACKKNEVVIGGGDNFDIKADFDVDIEKVISIFLIIDHAYFAGWGIRIPLITKIHEDGKPRNWQWQPKSKP